MSMDIIKEENEGSFSREGREPYWGGNRDTEIENNGNGNSSQNNENSGNNGNIGNNDDVLTEVKEETFSEE